MRHAFTKQRAGAKRRGVGWLLTYDEWMRIWSESGRLHLRGCGYGKYCMCRVGDEGPYAVGNVYIDTFSHNSQTGPRNHRQRILSALAEQAA